MQLLSISLHLLFFPSRSCSLEFGHLAEDSWRLAEIKQIFKSSVFHVIEAIWSRWKSGNCGKDVSGIITYVAACPGRSVPVCASGARQGAGQHASICVDPALDHSFAVKRTRTFQIYPVQPPHWVQPQVVHTVRVRDQTCAVSGQSHLRGRTSAVTLKEAQETVEKRVCWVNA